MKDLFVSFGVVVALVVGVIGVYLPGGVSLTEVQQVVQEAAQRIPVAATPGPDQMSHATFFDGLTTGGYSATTTNGTVRLVTRDLGNVAYFKVTPGSATTFTLPASSTLNGVIQRPGMCRDLVIENGSASNDVTISAGTGWDIKNASGTAVVIHGSLAQAKYCRMGSTDIALFLSPAGI